MNRIGTKMKSNEEGQETTQIGKKENEKLRIE